MKKIILGITAAALVVSVSCKKKTDDPTPTPTPISTEDSLGYKLSSDITSNRTLLSGKTYTLEAMVYVKAGATLTIPKGVTIKALKGKNGIVITRGSKIMAEGTVDSPIVFTSNEGTPTPGDWGGIVILGKATTNATFSGQAGVGEIEGGVNNSSGDGLYGGSDDNDNSGKLKYVRIEYAGYPFLADKELNSLTMGAVGRGTEIDYVQCSYGYDDAFEWFGGTVNCKHLIAYKTHDDNFDADFGYRGNVQFGIAITDPNDADVSGSNGFEIDNDATGSETSPFTAPVFANITIIGPKETSSTTINSNYKRAAHLRRNSRANIFNSILMGFPTGILVDGSKTGTQLKSGTLELRGILVAGSTKSFDTVGTSSTTLGALTPYLTTDNASWNNVSLTNTSDVSLSAPYATGASFNPNPTATSPAASNAASSSTGKLGSVTAVSYRGACSTNDTWWKTWTKF